MNEVIYEKRGKTAVIVINRPQQRNAINLAVRQGLKQAWERVDSDPDVLSVIITGGDEIFSAGQDLVELAEFRNHDPVGDFPLTTAEIFGAGVRKPVIAAISGYCLGLGLCLAISSDIRVASDNAKFGLPEVKVGNPAALGVTVKVAQYFPRGIALELLLLGEYMSAEDGYRLGFINKIAPQHEVMSVAETYADKINELSPVAVRSIKQAFYTGTNLPPQVIALADNMAKLARYSEDYREGFLAFKEKRKPVWKGR